MDDCRAKARDFHVRKDVCERATPAPVLRGARVAEEAELESHLALGPGGLGSWANASLISLEPRSSCLERGNSPDSSAHS